MLDMKKVSEIKAELREKLYKELQDPLKWIEQKVRQAKHRKVVRKTEIETLSFVQNLLKQEWEKKPSRKARRKKTASSS
jgi:hypothetical protein